MLKERETVYRGVIGGLVMALLIVINLQVGVRTRSLCAAVITHLTQSH